jgi:exonuclease SbcC
LRESQSRLDVLRERRRQDVDLPVQRVVQDLGALLAGTAVAHHALGRPSASTRFEAGEPTALAAEAGRVQQIAEQALADVSGAAWDLRQAVQGKLNEADDAVRAAGFASRDELEHELELVKRTGGATETRLRDAERQIPVARDLDQRIARGTGTADTLGELHRLLSDSQFVRHVIERRQRMLLVVASETLGAMTGRRYGFSADFQVVDRLSGQPRSTKTLSGGETFLASLALSLALVEIAGRAGGKLDALFLDEGFGSLDANALDEAMGALERRAGQGRLVAVVSHIKAVAERIETVLEVAKQPGGSVARWRDGTRAQELVEQELEAGLLT